MGPMMTLYIVCFCVGVVAFVIALARRRAAGGSACDLVRGPDDEVTVPGARIEPSDEYAVEGGAGGAEGEGGSPGYHDGADGGVGGAEGGADGIRIRQRPTWPAAFISGGIAGFGGAGYLVTSAGAGRSTGLVLAIVAGLALGVLTVAVDRFLRAGGAD